MGTSLRLKFTLLCGLSIALINCPSGYGESISSTDQFSNISISDHDRDTIEHQIKGQFPSDDPFQSWQIRNVRVWHDAGILKKYRILQVAVKGPDMLERMILPAGGSIGMFAFDGKKLLYLNGKQAKNNLSLVLKTENISLEQVRPEMFVFLLCVTMLQHRNDEAVILSSASDLQTYKGSFKSPGQPGNTGYKVDQIEYKKCSGQIKAPHIAGNRKAGWKVYFCALHGVMHDKRTVCLYETDVSPQFNIDMREKVLSNKIFSSVPRIDY